MITKTSFIASLLVVVSYLISPHALADQNAHAKVQSTDTPLTKISALKSSWDWGKYILTLNGDVSLSQGHLAISCDTARVTFTRSTTTDHNKKQPIELGLKGLNLLNIQADGDVSLTYKGLSLRATHVEYSHRMKRLKASGVIRGRWHSHRLTGRSLTINLTDEKVYLNRLNMSLKLSTDDTMKSVFGR